MNEFDQFVKHVLKVKHYARYTDDFIIISESQEYLEKLIPKISDFLNSKLLLEIHPKKILICKYHQGIDFLGYVVFPNHIIVRKKTLKRVWVKLKGKCRDFRNGLISEESLKQTIKSYEGIMSHANTHHLWEQMKNQIWLWMR